jgi:hypothetical protein
MRAWSLLPRVERKPWQWWGITVVWVAFVGVALTAWHSSAQAEKFDATRWNDSSEVAKGARLRMADGLVQTGALQGKTRAEVVALLGEPPATGYFTDWSLVYWLGPERGFMGIDSEWLVIALDDAGRVGDCRIVTD